MGLIWAKIIPFAVMGIIAALGGFFVGSGQGRSASHDLGRNFVRAYFFDAQECRIDKAALISQVGQERQRSREIIERFLAVDKLSGEARTRMMADLADTRNKLAVQEKETAERLAALQAEISEDAENWKRGVIPDAIVCGVFNGAGCTDRPAAASPDDGS